MTTEWFFQIDRETIRLNFGKTNGSRQVRSLAQVTVARDQCCQLCGLRGPAEKQNGQRRRANEEARARERQDSGVRSLVQTYY